MHRKKTADVNITIKIKYFLFFLKVDCNDQ